MPPGDLTRAIAAVLKDAAEQRGLSQAELGRRHAGTSMFVSQSQLSRFFSGQKTIDVDQLSGLCRTLSLDVVEVVEHAENGTLFQLNVIEGRFGVAPSTEDDLDAVARLTDPEPDEEPS